MAKINDIRVLAEETASDVASSPRDWMAYLDTAAKLYRYPFADNLLIHAQHPQATACAELETWNEKMGRWVNRGAKGIALIDDTGPRQRLRYVFDIEDTHMVRGGRTPYLWKMEERYEGRLLEYLTDAYGVAGYDTTGLGDALLAVASEMTEENLEEAMDGLFYEVKGSFLEEMDADSIRVNFRNLMVDSLFYTLARRCGLEPMEYLEAEDFVGITDFNDLRVLAFLGNAVCESAETVLRDIGRTVRKFYQEELSQQLAFSQNPVYNNNKKFNTLIRESKEKGEQENGTDISSQRRLSVSEPDHRGRTDDHREIRDASEDLSEGTQEELVSEYAAEREAEQPPDGDRENSTGEDGSPDGKSPEDLSGTGQRTGSDEVGSPHEQSDSDGRREHLEGIGVQLIEETTERDLSEAEEEIASALSLPELPTVKQQIRSIEERQAALYAGEISVPSDVVDEVLRKGGNKDRSHLRMIYNFMIEQTPEEYTEFVRREYGEGGIGLVIGGKEYSVWYDELGMQIAVGHTIHDQILDKAFLSWEEVSGRIHQLLRQGEYAPQSVLEAARANAVKEHAEVLAYMQRDMAEGVSELVFEDNQIFYGGFPEMVERIGNLLEQPEFLTDLNERLEGLAEAYEMDKEIMRFHYYHPDRVSAQFQKFAKEAVPYQAREGFQWQEHEIFITQDEIDAFLSRGGTYSDGRLTTYAFFIQDKSEKEKAEFIKEQYGIGGQSHALSGADHSHAEYNGKGVKLERGDYGNPDVSILLKWPAVAKRVQYLIDHDSYLKAGDYTRMPSYERERMANRVISFYARLPEEIERPFEEDFFYEKAREELPGILEDPDSAEQLVAGMDDALAELPLDFDGYENRVQILSEIHQYIEGTYTIFPQKKQEIEIEGTGRQMNLFDFMKSEPEPEITPKVQPEMQQKLNGEQGLEEADRTEDTDAGFYESVEEQIDVHVLEAMEKAGTSFDEFSPEQMDVIYSSAENGMDITLLLNPEFSPAQMQLIADVMERISANERYRFESEIEKLTSVVMTPEEINAQRQESHLPLEDFSDGSEIVPGETEVKGNAVEWKPEKQEGKAERVNFRITDDDLGAGGPKAKFKANMEAIHLLKKLEEENRLATPKEQEVLSRYVGWGGIPNAFDKENSDWAEEYRELYDTLTKEEYEAARASTLNAFYTSPTVIHAMYEALENMGLKNGNILEPSCGVGNFMGLLPESMAGSKMYGVELDSISGRMAKQLYQKNEIAVQGFETTEYPESFFDCVIGNVPFGAYKVTDRKYDRYNFMIHDYFLAKSIDLVRPGGVVAVVTSSGTMDKQSPAVREYLANRAELLGAIRLPNNAFMRNANTGVVADILFFQKRDRISLEKPGWVELGTTPEGYVVNSYFTEHPEAIVDIPFMAQLMDSSEETVIEELAGVIFKNPLDGKWETSDEYLSGNVREKLRMAEASAEHDPSFQINAEALRRVQPKELDASEIEVRLGAPWIKAEYINRFMAEIFHTPAYRLGKSINVTYAKINGQWNISGKTQDFGNPLITATYGTGRANAYRLLEDALNLKDTKIYDTVMEDGVEKRILNKKETMLVQQKQEMIKSAFKDWIFKDIRRREDICRTYNELFNSTRPREYDGSHIQFAGMTPEITLMPHQKNAIAHVLYGGNTLLAHCVGAGKTFEMIAAGMESKRLGLAQKNLYVVPNHLTEQWGNDFLRLYPGANILVATKKDFEPANRKKFCSRIATGEYDAVIIGHSQFEKIPLSKERQIETINRQIADITFAIEDMAREDGTRFTVKQMEKTKKTLQEKLKRLNDQTRKDDVVTFEQLGVDRLFVDESHYYKNLFLYTKMRNVAGILQTDAQKSSDMFMKCQYLDEITGGKGVTFATGTPISNSMTELYTIMRYLQYDTIQKMGLGHFDAWAASFGETVTAIELSPEGYTLVGR